MWPVVNDISGQIHTYFFVDYSQSFELLIIMVLSKRLTICVLDMFDHMFTSYGKYWIINTQDLVPIFITLLFSRYKSTNFVS